MGDLASGGKAWAESWTKNPLENAVTGGTVAMYKGGTATAGVNGPTSSSLGVPGIKVPKLPELFPGAKKVNGFDMPQTLEEAELQMIQRQSGIASGKAPSVADMILKQNIDKTNAAGLAMAASQRGASNPMLAFREAQIAGQEAQTEGAVQGAILAEQERRQADQMIGTQAAAARGVALQQNIANQKADTEYRNQNMEVLGNIGTAGVKAASDERVKTNKHKTNGSALKAVNEFLNSVEPFEYNYKGGDEVNRHGVMAQDLEKSEIGKQMVTDTPDGKVVDYGQGFSALMAGIAELNKKVSKLEKKKKAA